MERRRWLAGALISVATRIQADTDERSWISRSPEVARSLGATTAAVLKARNLSLADRPLDRVVESLQREKQGLSADLDGLYGRPSDSRSSELAV